MEPWAQLGLCSEVLRETTKVKWWVCSLQKTWHYLIMKFLIVQIKVMIRHQFVHQWLEFHSKKKKKKEKQD